MPIFYLSFANDDGWLGCVHTEADSVTDAIEKTHRLGINPGGEIAIFPLPQAALDEPEGRKIPQLLDRLLSMEQMREIYGGDAMVKIPPEKFAH